MKPVDVVGVRVEMPSNQPIVLLHDGDSDRYLPIWIGAVEATAIAFAQQGVVPERPLTHDLLKDVIESLGSRLVEVHITDLRDGVFFAELHFDGGSHVSARPSDAIALALRADARVLVSDAVLEEAAVELPDEEEAPDEVPDEQGEVARFREFLDQISPEDFGMGGETGPTEDDGGSR
jgi:uncharacterized protein